MRFPRSFRLLPVLLALPLALGACLGNTGSTNGAPTGVATTSGDGMFTVTWNQTAGEDYWMFLSQNPTLTATNWVNLSDGRAVQNVTPPTTVCNQLLYSLQGVTYSILNGGPVTYVTLNARTGNAPGGPGSPIVAGSGRASGNAWSNGAPVPLPVHGLAYAAQSGCGARGLPPWGQFVAIGPGGGLYAADWAPTSAGQPPQPGLAYTWTPLPSPPGFSGSLNAIATRAGGYLPSGLLSVRYVGVGDGGAIIASNDGQGQVWSNVGVGVTTYNLHAVSNGSGAFFAVGDGGTILASGDGVTWTLQGGGVSLDNLRAVRCVSGTCIAAGDNGALLGTSNGGSNWSLLTPPGTNNWRAIAYGSGNMNADYASVANGSPAINIWVVGDDQGNIAWSPNSGNQWAITSIPGAGPIVAIEYTSRFVALDASGNAFASEDGVHWSGGVPTGISSPAAMVSTGSGFLAAGTDGNTSISF